MSPPSVRSLLEPIHCAHCNVAHLCALTVTAHSLRPQLSPISVRPLLLPFIAPSAGPHAVSAAHCGAPLLVIVVLILPIRHPLTAPLPPPPLSPSPPLSHQPSALELFFEGGASALLAFSASGCARAAQALWAGAGAALEGPRSLSPRAHLEASRVTERWRQRELSNYEYLLALNTLAGRTFADLTQYPVMPWVLADYTSPALDLSDARSYRDLSKPIGALNPARLATFRARAEGLAGGGDIPPFLYGSHYSSAGVVLFYALRLQPFSSLAVELQGGRFDVADRLFFSIPECWRCVNASMSDVKELTPEWFTCPDMFTNGAGLPLGAHQDGTPVGDVVLPPWARSPEEFVWCVSPGRTLSSRRHSSGSLAQSRERASIRSLRALGHVCLPWFSLV